jgi:hypothetical protein
MITLISKVVVRADDQERATTAGGRCSRTLTGPATRLVSGNDADDTYIGGTT